MSLVEELGVSLKDFLPGERFHMISHEGRPIALVSERLYQKLKHYGDRNRMPIRSVLERLRAEVHAGRVTCGRTARYYSDAAVSKDPISAAEKSLPLLSTAARSEPGRSVLY